MPICQYLVTNYFSQAGPRWFGQSRGLSLFCKPLSIVSTFSRVLCEGCSKYGQFFFLKSTNKIPRLSQQLWTKWQVKKKTMSSFSSCAIVFANELLAGPLQPGQSCVRPTRTQPSSSSRLGLFRTPCRVWFTPLFYFLKSASWMHCTKLLMRMMTK